jgi:hypothetical protein
MTRRNCEQRSHSDGSNAHSCSRGDWGRTDKAFFVTVVRGMLGMANRQGGGTVVLGVAEQSASVLARGSI